MESIPNPMNKIQLKPLNKYRSSKSLSPYQKIDASFLF